MRVYPRKEKIKSSKGYVLVYAPEHPRASNKRVFEHIVVWETAAGMAIPDGCCIHHLNGVKDDNRIENLQLMTVEEHTILHNSNRRLSEETKRKIGVRAKERLKDKCNHPRYKEIPIDDLVEMVTSGETVVSVCRKYNIHKTTYYKKLKERGIKNG